MAALIFAKGAQAQIKFMKSFLEKIKNLFKKKNVAERHSQIRPYRDWVLIFSLTICGIVLVAVFSVYLLYVLQSGQFFIRTSTESSTRAGFEEAKLVEILGLYKSKQDAFTAKKGETIKIADPSL